MHGKGDADRVAIASDDDRVTRVRGSHRVENNLWTRNHPEFRVKEASKLGDLGRIGESLDANALGSGGPKGSLNFTGNSRKAHTGFGKGLDGAIAAIANVQLAAHVEEREGNREETGIFGASRNSETGKVREGGEAAKRRAEKTKEAAKIRM